MSQVLYQYGSTVHLFGEVAFTEDLSDKHKTTRSDKSLIAEFNVYGSHGYFLRVCICEYIIQDMAFGFSKHVIFVSPNGLGTIRLSEYE